MDSYNSPTTKPLFRGVQVVWYLLSLIEVILAFRFVLRLTGANAAAGFTNFVYGLARPLLAPFNAVFPQTVVEGSVFEWTTLLAMAVYYIVALGIIQLFLMGKSVSTPEAAAKLNNEEHFH
jgi:uncharacterized protein YggT (Ycf19 family)